MRKEASLSVKTIRFPVCGGFHARVKQRVHQYFVDAAHFVFGAFLGDLWFFARCRLKAPSGRQRFHVLGALNAITYEVITVTNLTSINAASVCQLLGKLGALG